MIKIVTLRLGLAGKLMDFNAGMLPVRLGDLCIVNDDRGQHYATVVEKAQIVQENCDLKKAPRIVRIATDMDREQIQRNREDVLLHKEQSTAAIRKSHLDMKLVDMEYAFDRSKLICYFTSNGRVDFRRLVIDLAKQFRLRIELRQIGVRDHARLMGGLGGCGRELCCSSHLRTFHNVSIQMAKQQELSVVPSKVSGVCGRLLCCLAYEYDQYKSLKKNVFPRGAVLELAQGKAVVIDSFVLKQQLRVEMWETGEERLCDLAEVKRVIEVPKKKIKTKDSYAKI